MREDHRTGFHCCQTLCHTVIGDLDSEEAWKHGTLGKETRFSSLLTKDCITTPPVTKLKDTQSCFCRASFLFFFFLDLDPKCRILSASHLRERPTARGLFSLLVSTWTTTSGMRPSTDAWYRLPDVGKGERQSLPVTVFILTCSVSTRHYFLYPRPMFISFFFSNALTTHDPRNDTQKKYRERKRGRERNVAWGRRRPGKERTGRGHQSTPRHTNAHTHIQNQFFSWGRGLILRNCLKTEIRYLCFFL